ncbi:hypothetical protein R6Q57_004992 [Mikania cordata]
MGRAPCCDKANVKKGPWSLEEDGMLEAHIQTHGIGGNWITLPQRAGLRRCGKSCRLRWLNYLRPDIKHGKFSDDEDEVICTLFASIGSRWSMMAAQLPGRTDGFRALYGSSTAGVHDYNKMGNLRIDSYRDFGRNYEYEKDYYGNFSLDSSLEEISKQLISTNLSTCNIDNNLSFFVDDTKELEKSFVLLTIESNMDPPPLKQDLVSGKFYVFLAFILG